jgi:hypothetical protein
MNNGSSRSSVHITNETPESTQFSILDDARNRLEILKLEQDYCLLYRIKWWGSWLLILLSYIVATSFICYVGYFLYLTTQSSTSERANEMKTIILASSGWFAMILNKIVDIIKKPNNKL